jgi:hypothetical protein
MIGGLLIIVLMYICRGYDELPNQTEDGQSGPGQDGSRAKRGRDTLPTLVQFSWGRNSNN